VAVGKSAIEFRISRILILKATFRKVSGFMSFHAPGAYLIPAWSWRQAQQRPAYRSKVGQVVVEESAIEFRDHQYSP